MVFWGAVLRGSLSLATLFGVVGCLPEWLQVLVSSQLTKFGQPRRLLGPKLGSAVKKICLLFFKNTSAIPKCPPIAWNGWWMGAIHGKNANAQPMLLSRTLCRFKWPIFVLSRDFGESAAHHHQYRNAHFFEWFIPLLVGGKAHLGCCAAQPCLAR